MLVHCNSHVVLGVPGYGPIPSFKCEDVLNISALKWTAIVECFVELCTYISLNASNNVQTKQTCRPNEACCLDYGFKATGFIW